MKNSVQRTTRLLRAIADLFFPFQCIACNTYTEQERMLCDKCLPILPIENGIHCPVCDKRLIAFTKCHPSPLTAIAYATSYTNPLVRDLIHAYKYEGVSTCVNDLGQILERYCVAIEPLFSIASFHESALLVPIPLHPLRERMRGFNQASLLTNHLSTRFNIPTHNILQRIRNNTPQAQMKSKVLRKENAEYLFMLRPDTEDTLNNKIIILVDDVATSGATLASAAQNLCAAGAKKIIALVVAKG